ncbi:MAG: thiamine-phosphate kinase [Zetaproteobacteria bacterium CG1_02_49_23]|nr:MAG: thiamine-phosphate kinase [Zetaproteobacteria bacterium CG1_02_49_23]
MGAGEFQLIQSCFGGKSEHLNAATTLGIGDDASIHKLEPGMQWVVSTDSSIESVHWPSDLPLAVAADRAICSALSDLAAMGAQPLMVWQNVMAKNSQAVREMAQGSLAALNRHQVQLVGGDTCRSPVNALSVTVAGQLPEGTAMLRSAARAGDAIWLVGTLGFHALGLQQWMDGHQTGCFVADFTRIEPKLAQGQRLRQAGVRCCIDISDGLLQDTGHVANASAVRMDIDLQYIPGWEKIIREAGRDRAIQAVTSGGEDYALLFTAADSVQLPVDLAVKIGHCSQGEGVYLSVDKEELVMQSLRTGGYDHFS